jgi:hypothetical protein
VACAWTALELHGGLRPLPRVRRHLTHHPLALVARRRELQPCRARMHSETQSLTISRNQSQSVAISRTCSSRRLTHTLQEVEWQQRLELGFEHRVGFVQQTSSTVLRRRRWCVRAC